MKNTETDYVCRMSNVLDWVRQGDVSVTKISKSDIPSGDRISLTTKSGKSPLALGEVTGHAHEVLDYGVEFFTVDNPEYAEKLKDPRITGVYEKFMIVKNPKKLVLHEEHYPLVLGDEDEIYGINPQWEYTPEEYKRVRD